MINENSMYINIFTRINNKEVYEKIRKTFFDKVGINNGINKMTMLKQEYCEDVYLRIIFVIAIEMYNFSSISNIKEQLNLEGYPELFTDKYLKAFIDLHTEEIEIIEELINNITIRKEN